MKQNNNIAAKADKHSTKNTAKQGYGPVKDGIRQYLPTGVYFLFQQINGKLYRDSLETTDPAEAVTKKADAIAKIKGDLKKGIDAKKAQLWSYYETKYRENLDHRMELHKSGERDGLAEGSVKNYRLGLKRLHGLYPTLASTKITEVDQEKLQNIFKKLRVELGKTQHNSTYYPVRDIFQLAIEDKVIDENPMAKVKRSTKAAKDKHIPEKVEWNTFINAVLDPSYRNCHKFKIADFLQGLTVTGLRREEADVCMKDDVKIWTELDEATGQKVKRGTLRVRKSKTDAGTDRIIDLMPAAIEMMEKLLKVYPGDKLFPVAECDNTFRHICEDVLKLKRRNQKNEWEPVRYTHHTCRHMFATYALEAGCSWKTLAEWLGHADGGQLAMRTYGHLRREFAKAEAAKIKVDLIGVGEQKVIGGPTQQTQADVKGQIATLQAELAKLQARVTRPKVVVLQNEAAA